MTAISASQRSLADDRTTVANEIAGRHHEVDHRSGRSTWCVTSVCCSCWPVSLMTYVMQYGRRWRPGRGAAAALEVVWSVTDPPLQALRRVIPPMRVGTVSFDISFMLLLLILIRADVSSLVSCSSISDALGGQSALTRPQLTRGVPDAADPGRRPQRRLQEAPDRQAGVRRGGGRRLPRRGRARARPSDRGEQRAARLRRRRRPAAPHRPVRAPTRASPPRSPTSRPSSTASSATRPAAEQAARAMQVELEQIRAQGGPVGPRATASSRRCGC